MAGDRSGLARGPAARAVRAAVRRGIAAGNIDLPALLRGAGDQDIETTALDMRVMDLVTAAVPSAAAMVRVMTAATTVDADARLATLTIARRAALADAIQKEIAA